MTDVYIYGGFPSTWLTLIYTAPPAGTVTVTSIIATNSTDVDATLILEHVPQGKSPGEGYTVANNLTISAGSSNDLAQTLPTIIMNPGDMLLVSQSAYNTVSLEVDGTLDTSAP